MQLIRFLNKAADAVKWLRQADKDVTPDQLVNLVPCRAATPQWKWSRVPQRSRRKRPPHFIQLRRVRSETWVRVMSGHTCKQETDWKALAAKTLSLSFSSYGEHVGRINKPRSHLASLRSSASHHLMNVSPVFNCFWAPLEETYQDVCFRSHLLWLSVISHGEGGLLAACVRPCAERRRCGFTMKTSGWESVHSAVLKKKKRKIYTCSKREI